jgi:hypothetical protein
VIGAERPRIAPGVGRSPSRRRAERCRTELAFRLWHRRSRSPR